MDTDHRVPNARALLSDLRRALAASIVSIVWTATASVLGIFLGVAHHVLTLVVFGFAGLLDGVGSTMLAIHFRHALRTNDLSPHHERRATVVVTTGLIVFGVVALVESARRILEGSSGSGTRAGTAVAAASVVMLAGLAVAKRRLGQRLESPSLRADGVLSGSGAVLAVLAVLGVTVGTRDGWWWVDPLIAGLVGVLAGGYGTRILAGEQRRHRQPPSR